MGTRSVALILALLLLGALAPGPGPSAHAAHIPRPPIVIEGDDDFTQENGVVGGSGTAVDPFRISGWAIASPPYPLRAGAIVIRNTTAHALVTDNIFTAPVFGADHYCAIAIFSAANVTVQSNGFYQSVSGVCAFSSNNIQVVENAFYIKNREIVWGLALDAVILRSTDHSSVVGNEISGYMEGVGVSGDSKGNYIAFNSLRQTGPAGGIAIHWPAEHNIVHHNEIYDHHGGAIQAFGNGTVVTHNLVEGTATYGVKAGSRSRSGEELLPEGIVITDNTFLGTQRGIDLICGSCHVTHNRIRQTQIAINVAFLGDNDLSFNKIEETERLKLAASFAANNSFPIDLLELVAPDADLRFNWWGSPDGPQNVTIKGSPLLEPWLTAEPEGVGPRTVGSP